MALPAAAVAAAQPFTGRRGLAHFSAGLIVALRERAKAEKCACPLAAEGDSHIFAAAKRILKGHIVSAAKIGTVPVNGYAAAIPRYLRSILRSPGHVSNRPVGRAPVL